MNTATYRASVERIRADFSASFWLKRAVEELSKRDPVDALNDVSVLLNVTKQRNAEAMEACKIGGAE